jgi:prevent-host-death family protein
MGSVMVVTTKELRLNASKILKKVQRIGSVTVTLRGKPVAKLTPLNEEKVMRAADHPAFGMWADREGMKDVHAWLRKTRTPRYIR